VWFCFLHEIVQLCLLTYGFDFVSYTTKCFFNIIINQSINQIGNNATKRHEKGEKGQQTEKVVW